jgi:hypothetical protein
MIVKGKLKMSDQGKYAGKSLIERIEIQMDKRRKAMEDIIVNYGSAVVSECDPTYIINKGRYEGFAAALGILRSSSVPHEVSRSNERLGIE